MGIWKTAMGAAAIVALLGNVAAKDPENPTCPLKPNWAAKQKMTLNVEEVYGEKVLLAEGVVDAGMPERLRAVIKEHPDIAEIWLRSPGGNARAGNSAGLIIRKELGLVITRIPKGWSCFSACNFVFMGGKARIIEDGGNFMVHMFTLTGDRDTIDQSVALGTDDTIALIGEIEQESALLATEDNDFLIRMGVSRKLLSEVMYRQQAVKNEENPSTRYCLSVEEAFKYNVANVGAD
jgi:hypothetical protein